MRDFLGHNWLKLGLLDIPGPSINLEGGPTHRHTYPRTHKFFNGLGKVKSNMNDCDKAFVALWRFDRWNAHWTPERLETLYFTFEVSH